MANSIDQLRMAYDLPGVFQPPRPRGTQLAGAMLNNDIKPVDMIAETDAAKRRALADIMSEEGFGAPIQGGGGIDSALQGFARGAETYIKTKAARDERESEEKDRTDKKNALAQVMSALGSGGREAAMQAATASPHTADLALQLMAPESKPVNVGAGDSLVDPTTGRVIHQGQTREGSPPYQFIEGDSEVFVGDRRTGEEAGRYPIRPRPQSSQTRRPLPPGWEPID